MKIHHCHVNSSHQIYHFDDIGSVYMLSFSTLFNYVLLYWAILILSRVGGWLGKSKNIDHLSPAKAETRTELGNIMQTAATQSLGHIESWTHRALDTQSLSHIGPMTQRVNLFISGHIEPRIQRTLDPQNPGHKGSIRHDIGHIEPWTHRAIDTQSYGHIGPRTHRACPLNRWYLVRQGYYYK